MTSNSQVAVISAIAFGSRYDGIIGGNYSAANPTLGNTAYVRKINDEAGDFSSKFYYDRLGRIVVSQNSRQRSEGKYSYTLYDALGRVYEAGEKAENTAATAQFPSVFGTFVNQQYIPTVIDDSKLAVWLTTTTGSRNEVTRSYYDQTSITGLPFAFNSETQRKRIVHVTYEEVFDNNDQTYDHATHYNYDIHGNVKNLWQDNRKMVVEDNQLAAQQFKQTEYVYDLVSGNVHRVSYQRGKVDQFHHVYRYDADNRIIEAHTTETTPLSDPKYGVVAIQNEPQITPYWHKDVSYEYYRHGPLARTMLGTQNVQGLDYIYTLQGWLKGVNPTDLDKDRSYRGDGYNTRFAKDVFSYGLHYYLRDYKSISSNYDVFAAQNEDDWLVGTSSYSNLFNGNIASMVTTITEPQTRDVLVMGNRYKYDQLNRLIHSESSTDAYDASAYGWNTSGTTIYENVFKYDANGNILNQERSDQANHLIDGLVYTYDAYRNRLRRVEDLSVSYSEFSDDIDLSRYTYDEEGRLKTDSQEGIADIVWRVDGKVKAIVRDGVNPNQKNLTFDYEKKR